MNFLLLYILRLSRFNNFFENQKKFIVKSVKYIIPSLFILSNSLSAEILQLDSKNDKKENPVELIKKMEKPNYLTAKLRPICRNRVDYSFKDRKGKLHKISEYNCILIAERKNKIAGIDMLIIQYEKEKDRVKNIWYYKLVKKLNGNRER